MVAVRVRRGPAYGDNFSSIGDGSWPVGENAISNTATASSGAGNRREGLIQRTLGLLRPTHLDADQDRSRSAGLARRARMRLSVSGVTPRYDARWNRGTRCSRGERAATSA